MTTDHTSSSHAPRTLTATLTSVSYALVLLLGSTTGTRAFSAPPPDVQSAPLIAPDCPDGYGWVPPKDFYYSNCRNAGPLTTIKPYRGMLAPDVCALNAAAGYTWNATDRTCSVAVAPPPDPCPACDTGGGGGGGGDGWTPDSGGGGGGCFLTTATVHALGMADDCEDLTLARYMRDNRMADSKGKSATALYYKVAPLVVKRKPYWADFYVGTVQPLTALAKEGRYDEAVKLYTQETVRLIDEYATRYSDKAIVETVYAHAFGHSLAPYTYKFLKLKLGFKVGLFLADRGIHLF